MQNKDITGGEVDAPGSTPSSQPGGCDYMSFSDAQKLFQNYIDCEMRDPAGLNDTAKAMLSYWRMVDSLKNKGGDGLTSMGFKFAMHVSELSEKDLQAIMDAEIPATETTGEDEKGVDLDILARLELLQKRAYSHAEKSNGPKEMREWIDADVAIIRDHLASTGRIRGESGFSNTDNTALAAFKRKYPTWWYRIGVCDYSRDFTAAPQGHSPEAAYIKKAGDFWDVGFMDDSQGTLADAIENVMEQIAEALPAAPGGE